MSAEANLVKHYAEFGVTTNEADWVLKSQHDDPYGAMGDFALYENAAAVLTAYVADWNVWEGGPIVFMAGYDDNMEATWVSYAPKSFWDRTGAIPDFHCGALVQHATGLADEWVEDEASENSFIVEHPLKQVRAKLMALGLTEVKQDEDSDGEESNEAVTEPQREFTREEADANPLDFLDFLEGLMRPKGPVRVRPVRSGHPSDEDEPDLVDIVAGNLERMRQRGIEMDIAKGMSREEAEAAAGPEIKQYIQPITQAQDGSDNSIGLKWFERANGVILRDFDGFVEGEVIEVRATPAGLELTSHGKFGKGIEGDNFNFIKDGEALERAKAVIPSEIPSPYYVTVHEVYENERPEIVTVDVSMLDADNPYRLAVLYALQQEDNTTRACYDRMQDSQAHERGAYVDLKKSGPILLQGTVTLYESDDDPLGYYYDGMEEDEAEAEESVHPDSGMPRKSSDPRDWFFQPYPKKYWESKSRPMVFINPIADGGEWDQSTYPDLKDTVFAKLSERFKNADEPMECHVEITGGTEEELWAALKGLGMEQREWEE